jgi:uncharacterized membrane protein
MLNVIIALIGMCSGIAIAAFIKGMLFTGNFPYNIDTFLTISFVGLVCILYLIYVVVNEINKSIRIIEPSESKHSIEHI